MRKFARRYNKKTNYSKRLRLLKSRKNRIVLRKTNYNINLQLIKYEPKADKTLLSLTSKKLNEFGWFPKANTPTAYLTGYLFGAQMLKNGYKNGVVDIDLKIMPAKTELYAAVKGMIDAGIELNVDEKAFPSEDRIKGKHIADYAKENKEKFSAYEKNNFNVLEIEKIFDETKNKIKEKYGVESNE